jgi:hypothetical protein
MKQKISIKTITYEFYRVISIKGLKKVRAIAVTVAVEVFKQI